MKKKQRIKSSRTKLSHFFMDKNFIEKYHEKKKEKNNLKLK